MDERNAERARQGGRRLPAALLAIAAGWAGVILQRVQPLTWDEIEFFRATRWIAEGRLPFRDFWEHHTPLQWFLFAPFAALFDGVGVSAVLAMRWAQVPLWIAAFALLFRIAKSMRQPPHISVMLLATAMLLATPSFTHAAVQYRVDVPGNLAFLSAVALLLDRRWIAFGATSSAAVLFNMRLAPLVIVCGLIALFLDDAGWRWRPRALWMAIGIVPCAAIAVGWLWFTGSFAPFFEAVVTQNRLFEELVAPRAERMLLSVVSAPFLAGEISGIALWILALIGVAAALRQMRRPAADQLLALLFIAAVGSVVMMAVQYDYHLLTIWLLMVPAAAVALEKLATRVRHLPLFAAAIVGLALLLNGGRLLIDPPGEELDYQDLIIREVHARTAADARVWDGVGYALDRQPAYRYWFLPALVRLLAEKGAIEPFDIKTDPPAAIVFSYRIYNWMRSFPEVGRFATTHYVPLYRNLWVPGFSAALPAGSSVRTWRAIQDGEYEIWSSAMLASHPWLRNPVAYGLIEGADAPLMQIPLERLPPLSGGELRWSVDGAPQASGRVLRLRKGSRVELRATLTQPAGVLVVPRGIRRLAIAPAERFAF